MVRFLFAAAALTWSLVQASGGILPNDDFSGRLTLAPGLPSLTGNTPLSDASSEFLEPNGIGGATYYDDTVYRSAWWSWTAGATGCGRVSRGAGASSTGVWLEVQAVSARLSATVP